MSKVRNLTETTTLDDNDLLYAVDVSAGTNGGRKITKANLKESTKQSPAEIKTAYENNADTNAFTDAEKAKLATVEVDAAFQEANEVPYDNTASGLSATDAQAAIDEVNVHAQADFRPSIVSGRILHYTGGTARFDGTFFQLVAGDILLSPNVTNGEIYVDLDGLVKQTASGVLAPAFTMVFAKFSTDLNNIISLTDERVKNSQNIVRGLIADVRDVRAGAAASEGSSGRVSDAMHKHNILTGAPSTQIPDQANAEGTSPNLARADHIHQIAADAPTTTLAPSTTNAEGAGTSFSRNDHTHAISTALVGVITTIQPDDAAAAGTADSYARGDHKHAIAADVPVSLTPDQSNAEGAATAFARSNHVHNVPTAAAVGLDSASTNTQGAASTFARSNHTHAIASAAPVTQTADQANAAGASAGFAKADHVHQIPTAVAVDVGAANAQGASGNFAKADHVHKGLHSVKANAGTQRFNDVSLVDGLGASVVDDGSGNFTVDTKFGANEFVVTSFAGLTINYTGGRFVNGQNGTVNNIPAGSIVVSANVALGYLYVSVNNLTGTGVVASAVTAPPLDSIPFAQFTSGPSAVTSTTDSRSFVNLVPVANTLRVGYSGSGLTVTYNSGGVRINGVQIAVAASSLVLTNSVASGAIYVDPTTGLVAANTTGLFPANCVPMATYTTSGGAVTALSLVRSFINGNIVFGLAGDISALTPDIAAAAGTTNKYADAGHVHNVPADAPTTTLSPATANAEGAGASFARNDHTHAIATALVADITTIQPDATAAAGAANTYARGDHRHAIVADAPTTTLSPATSNAEGAGTSFARNDHTHAIATALVADISTIQPDDTAAAGVANTYARGDHKHAIVAAPAVSISTATANAEGVGTSFARNDHTHAVSVTSSEVSAITDDTTASTTDVLMASMTLTPAAGTYLAIYSTEVVNSANGVERTYVSLWSAGAQVVGTERAVGTAGAAYSPVFTQAVITVNGSQAIEGRWRVLAGTSTAHQRRLTLVKLA